jgi:hypothetical protein
MSSVNFAIPDGGAVRVTGPVMVCVKPSLLQQRWGFNTAPSFPALTGMSPLQYQNQFRLRTARQRMLMAPLDATTAAYESGYGNVSQFSREYSRFFGLPPIRDVKVALHGNAAWLKLLHAAEPPS